MFMKKSNLFLYRIDLINNGFCEVYPSMFDKCFDKKWKLFSENALNPLLHGMQNSVRIAKISNFDSTIRTDHKKKFYMSAASMSRYTIGAAYRRLSL